MTTLATDAPRPIETGDYNNLPSIAADITYEGAAVGVVPGTGHGRPLTAADRFGGFCAERCDNSVGAAGDKTIRVLERGKVELTISGVVITDVGQPVYATDDATFQMSPVGGVFVGFVHRWVSSGVAVIRFDATGYRDPWGAYTARETISDDKTLDAEDTGKLFWVTTDAKTIALPAIATGLDGCVVVNGGSFGTVAVNISPAAADMILGPDITGADNKDLINTKATARRGDFVILGGNDADGYAVQAMRGTWAREA